MQLAKQLIITCLSKVGMTSLVPNGDAECTLTMEYKNQFHYADFIQRLSQQPRAEQTAREYIDNIAVNEMKGCKKQGIGIKLLHFQVFI